MEAPAVPQVRLGIQLASLRLPVKQALPQAAALGAEAVEIDARHELRPRDLSESGLRHFRKLLEDYRLRVSAITFQTQRGYDVTDQLDQRVAATQEALEFAHRLGARVVVNSVGNSAAAADSPERARLVSTLADLGQFGQRVGAMLAARTGAESGADLAGLIDALPDGSLGVDLDPGALLVNGFSVPEALTALRSHILHVHATDGVNDGVRRRGRGRQLGQGEADYPQILATLGEAGYRGFFTIECAEAREPVAEIAEAVRYLRSL